MTGRRLRVLELGSYVSVAYAGMILAEQGHTVEKWTAGADPILGLDRGLLLWEWINAGKRVETRRAETITALDRTKGVDVVIDNIRAATWARWGVDLEQQARRLGVTWVSLRADDDQRSFDVIAQARAWGDMGHLPFYIGDTAAGLWLAFKALAADHGHHVIRQATCLAKLVEGEGVVPRRTDLPWDEPDTYGWLANGHAAVVFKGETVTEPRRDHEWRLEHLANDHGRYRV